MMRILLAAAVTLALGGGAATRASQGTDIVVLGQVLGPKGALARARIELLPLRPPFEQGLAFLRGELDPPPAAGALSDAKGSFRVEAPAAGMWRLIVEAPGLAPMEYPLVPLTEETDLPPVELHRDSGLEVRVTDEKGAPVAGAQVLTSPEHHRDANTAWRPAWEPAKRAAVSGRDGKAVLPFAGGGSLRLEVTAPGFRPAILTGARRSQVSVRLERGIERTLEVRDSNRQLAKDVVAWIEDMALPAAVAEQGKLAVRLPLKEKARIRLLAASSGQLAADISPPSSNAAERPVRLTLAPADAFSGRVIDLLTRRPIPEAIVWIGRSFDSWVRTDRAGGYTVTVGVDGRGVLPLLATAPGYFEANSPVPATTGLDQGPTFALHAKVSLAGSVVDDVGQPIGGVEIRARFEPSGIGLSGDTLLASGGMTRSRSTGRFRIADLTPSATYSLRFARPGFAPQTVRAEAPPRGNLGEPLQVVLSSGQSAFGWVRDQQEKPVPGASVTLTPVATGMLAKIRRFREPDPALEARALTDSEGRFEVRALTPGRYELAVTARGFAATRVPGVVVAAERERLDLGTVTLLLEVVLTGRVQTADESPVDSARVSIVPAELLSETASDAQPSSATDAAGVFQIGGQRPGDRVKLRIEREGFATEEIAGIAVPQEKPLVVVLNPASRLAGRVLDDQGHPVSGASLVAIAARSVIVAGLAVPSGEVYQSRSRDDGSFLFDRVQPGRVDLEVRASGWQDTDLSLQVPPGKDLEDVEIVLRKAASLTGLVLAPDGEPVIGANVSRREPELPGLITYRAPLTTTDGEGRYRIDGLAPGPLSLVASHSAYGKVRQDTRMEPGDNVLDFRFEGGSAISGRVLDSAGLPVEAAQVWLLSSSLLAAPPQTLSATDGSYAFEGLTPGQYELQAKKVGVGATSQPVPVQLADKPTSEVVLQLGRTGSIRGSLFGLDMIDLSRVRLFLGSAPAENAQVGFDGEFSILDVPAGTWIVTAQIAQTGRQTEGEVLVDPDAGEARLDLDFRQGLSLIGTVRRNGQPLPGAHVRALGSSGSPVWSQTDPQGGFVFRGLAQSLYQLEVSDFRTGLVYTRDVDLREDTDIHIDLTTSTLAGIIVDDETGQPVGEAEIALMPQAASRPVYGGQRTESNGDGSFLFLEVAAGTWRLMVTKPGYGPGERTVRLAGVGAQTIEIHLTPSIPPNRGES